MATISLTRIKSGLYSIRWKILVAYLLIIGVAFSVVGVSLLQLVGEYLFTQRVRDDQRVADSLAEQMREPMAAMDVDAMYLSALEICADGLSRVLVLDRYGVVQVDTLSILNGTRLQSAEAADVLAGAESSYGFYNGDDSPG